MQPLPIDAILPDVLRAVDSGSRLVLEAPPGAGKTTRVPWALTQQPWCTGRVLVSEPRRIAARLAARRVAEEQGQRLGDTVGYRVRFEDVTGAHTRLAYLTEGTLLRQLMDDPRLAGTSCVVLDELHERNLDADLCLALLERLQREHRPELRLVVMSATLDAGGVASYLHDAPRLRSEGRVYPVEIRHARQSDDRPLEKRVRSAIREALERDGNVLVFLPGAAEIRRCQEAIAELPDDVETVALHGDLPIDEQARAVASAPRRRIVLATNVAESSVTIPDITTVIDSGLARVARHSPWSGLGSLELEEISQARAIQRAGRAGRTQAGVAVRLYTAGNFAARPVRDAPAIEREDLSGAVLTLASRGDAGSQGTPGALRWLTPPPDSSWQAATALLESLGALRRGALTEIGQHMVRLPLHPRLARLLVEGQRRGCADRACLAAALLSERDIRRETRTRWTSATQRIGATGDSDLLDMIDRFEEAAETSLSRQALSRLELDPAATRSVERLARQLRRQLVRPRPPAVDAADGTARDGAAPHDAPRDEDEALALCVLAAFSDRVAQRRGDGRELLLANGSTAMFAETSVVHRAPWVVALSADRAQGRRGQAIVRIASRIEPDWLLDLYPDRLELEESLSIEGPNERVERTSRLRYGRLVLDESRARAEPGPAVAELLSKAARAKGLAFADPRDALTTLQERLRLLHEQGVIDLGPEGLDVGAKGLELGCAQVTSLAELADLDLGQLVLATLPGSITRDLATQAPLRIRLASGRELTVHYEPGKPPWIQSRLQDFFGLGETPRICQGRLALQLHLLAPNQRAVQVTTDLAGFWERHYQGIRKELMRRYPRHPWPEDGRNATPPAPRPPRSR